MIELLHGAGGLRDARTQARQVCSSGGVDQERTDAAVLILSELAGNALRHGLPPVQYMTALDRDEVLVTVEDGAPWLALPWAAAACASDESGRGLFLVSSLSRSWGWTTITGGKQVWARV